MAEPQQPAPAESAEPDALDALDAALADDPTGDGEPEEWTPPTREEYEAQKAAHQAELEKERAKLERARKQAQRLREGKPATPAAAEGQAPAADGEDLAKWQTRAVRASAREALKDKGADPDLVELALARLKPGTVEFDEDDEPLLDEWLDEMQERYPKLFASAAPAAAAPARRPGRVDQGAGATGQPARPQLSLGEKILAKSEAARRAGGRSRI